MRRKHLNVICPFMSVCVRVLSRRRMRIGRLRTEKELYMRGMMRTDEEEVLED